MPRHEPFWELFLWLLLECGATIVAVSMTAIVMIQVLVRRGERRRAGQGDPDHGDV